MTYEGPARHVARKFPIKMTDTTHRPDKPAVSIRLLRRVVNVEPNEVPALLWSFTYFFCLLSSYYILRPLRDEMGIAGGVDKLQWVFTGTFVVMLAAVPLFGYASARLPRRKLLPGVYGFFIANILIFYALFKLGNQPALVARAFFIWTSVFNLFVISVFWSFMADLFSNIQARRLFGFIAAGGSLGAVVGPSLTALLVAPLGPVNLLLVSAGLLGAAVLCIRQLVSCAHPRVASGHQQVPRRITTAPQDRNDRPIGGGLFSGIRLLLTSPYLLGIGLFIWLYTTLATFLYFSQAQIIAAAFDDPAQRTALFAWMDFAVNALTILTQTLLTGRLLKWLGVARTLALIPLLMVGGFIGLALTPILPILVGFQIIRRAGNYAITRPAREILFTVVGREVKYKAKNVIDTLVYRGGDAISGWVFVGLKALGLGLSGIAIIAVPLALAWMTIGLLLGKKQEQLRQNEHT